VRLPEVFLDDDCLPDVVLDEDVCLEDADCFPLVTFFEADRLETDGDGFAVDFADFLAAVFFVAALPAGAGVAAHTASAVLNARTIRMATERKRLVPNPA
jgi:hypothetical protein